MVEETCDTKINNGNEMIENCNFHAKKVKTENSVGYNTLAEKRALITSVVFARN